MTETAIEEIGRGDVSFINDTAWRDLADAPVFTVFRRMRSTPRGLTEREAADRLRRCGDNEPPRLDDERFAARVGDAVRSPFVMLLAGLGALFATVGDARGASVVSLMVVASATLGRARRHFRVLSSPGRGQSLARDRA